MNEAATPAASTVIQPTMSKQLVDAYLDPIITQRIEDARSMEPSYAALWQATGALLFAGGKRFRPYMTLLVFQAYSDAPIETIVPAAAAQELLHLGVLVHDDVIDRDYIRYGVKNISGAYKEQYRHLIHNDEDLRHYADSAAILAGDLLLSEAYLQLSNTKASAELVLEAQRLMAQAVYAVVGGELLDTEAAFKKVASAHPLTIAEQKTSSYSFIMPFMIGATFAKASEAQKTLLTEFGKQLGIAYQMRDDIIGVFGDESVTGKSTEGDIREGKRTVLIDEFYRHATDEQRQTFDRLFGNPDMATEDIATVRSLLQDSGALAAIEATIETYTKQLTALIQQFEMSDSHKHSFQELIALCLQREK